MGGFALRSHADAASARAHDARTLQTTVERLQAHYPQLADLDAVRNQMLMVAAQIRVLNTSVAARNQRWIDQLAALGALPSGWKVHRFHRQQAQVTVVLRTPDGDCGKEARQRFSVTLGIDDPGESGPAAADKTACHWSWTLTDTARPDAPGHDATDALAAPSEPGSEPDALEQAESALWRLQEYLLNAEAYAEMRGYMVEVLRQARTKLLPPKPWTADVLAHAGHTTGATSVRFAAAPEPGAASSHPVIEARGGLAALVRLLEHLTTEPGVDDAALREPLLQRELLELIVERTDGLSVRYRDQAWTGQPPAAVGAQPAAPTQSLDKLLELDGLSEATRRRIAAVLSRPPPPVLPPPVLELPAAHPLRTVRGDPFQ